MGNLLTSLLNSANALGIYSRALDVVGNNVTNSNTPGYAKQELNLESLPFDITVGLPGGVAAGSLQSSRDAYAEQNVRQQQSGLGAFQAQSNALSNLSTLFDLSGKTGVNGALDNLFQGFSSLSVSPNDNTARQNVLNQAAAVANAFNQTSSGLSSASAKVSDDTRTKIDAINQIAGTIAQINSSHIKDYKGDIDAGLDAKLNSSLENLSQYIDYTALQQPDGGVTVYIGGQTPLVFGNQAEPIKGDFSTPQTAILDSAGKDITSQITGGQLGGLLQVHNQRIPSYQADLNTLASSVADQINTALANGVDANGAAPATNLFTYDSTSGAAASLAVNPLTTDQIAAALPGAPGGNGNALQLAALATAKPVNGKSFNQFFGELGGRVGLDISAASTGVDTQTAQLSQAQSLRQQASGVDLNAEAAKLVQFQSAYQAATKLVTVLDQLTQTTINMISGG